MNRDSATCADRSLKNSKLDLCHQQPQRVERSWQYKQTRKRSPRTLDRLPRQELMRQAPLLIPNHLCVVCKWLGQLALAVAHRNAHAAGKQQSESKQE